jgi:hypothetical protein
MNWWKRKPSPEKKAVDAETQKLDVARYERQGALQRLMRAIEESPLENALLGLTNDLSNHKKNGH